MFPVCWWIGAVVLVLRKVAASGKMAIGIGVISVAPLSFRRGITTSSIHAPLSSSISSLHVGVTQWSNNIEYGHELNRLW